VVLRNRRNKEANQMNKTTAILWSLFALFCLYLLFCMPHGDGKENMKSIGQAQQLEDARLQIDQAVDNYNRVSK
jgi:preprotein translocase subunit SecG